MVTRLRSHSVLSAGVVACAVIALLAVVPVPAVGGTSGDLDPTFGDDGQVATAFAGYGGAVDLAMLGGGRILVVGSFGFPARIGVARYLPNGDLDPAFGDAGKASIGFAGGAIRASALVVLPGGGFVVGGTFDPTGDRTASFALARFHQDGRLDTTFGNNGRVVADLGGDSWYLNDLVRQINGKLVAGGEVDSEDPDGFPPSFGLARFDAGGSVDASYGDDGRVVTSFPIQSEESEPRPLARAQGLTVDMAGRVVAVGSAGWYGLYSCNFDWALARYLTDGRLDRSFGGDGRVVTRIGGNIPSATDVRFGDDNRLTVVGYVRYTGCAESSPPDTGVGAVARYYAGGKLDHTFSGDGKVTTAFFGTDLAQARFEAMTLEEGGWVVAVGSAVQQSSGRTVVIAASYFRNGHLNTNFSDDGRAWAAGPSRNAIGSALFEDPDGRPVVAGMTWNGGRAGRFLVERFNRSS